MMLRTRNSYISPINTRQKPLLKFICRQSSPCAWIKLVFFFSKCVSFCLLGPTTALYFQYFNESYLIHWKKTEIPLAAWVGGKRPPTQVKKRTRILFLSLVAYFVSYCKLFRRNLINNIIPLYLHKSERYKKRILLRWLTRNDNSIVAWGERQPGAFLRNMNIIILLNGRYTT